jgi:hypothetical protein
VGTTNRGAPTEELRPENSNRRTPAGNELLEKDSRRKRAGAHHQKYVTPGTPMHDSQLENTNWRTSPGGHRLNEVN